MWTIDSYLRIGNRRFQIAELLTKLPVLYAAQPIKMTRSPYMPNPKIDYTFKPGQSLGKLESFISPPNPNQPELILQFRDQNKRPYYCYVQDGSLSLTSIIEQGVTPLPTQQEIINQQNQPKDAGEALYKLLNLAIWLGAGVLVYKVTSDNKSKR